MARRLSLDILASDETKVGFTEYTIFDTPEEVHERFEKFDAISHLLEAPVGEFEMLKVFEQHERKGYGLKGVEMVNEQFDSLGVNIGVLRVAWYGEEPWEAARDRRVRLYERGGWVRVDDLGEFTQPTMIRQRSA